MKPRERASWFNAIADAWNEGSAPWAYENGKSVAVREWEYVRSQSGAEIADIAVANLAMSHGLMPRRKSSRD